MKKLLAILLTCITAMGIMVIPASADSIYYPCYEGEWYEEGNTEGLVKLEITKCTNDGVDFSFQYYQFAVNVHGNFVDGATIKASYNETWDGGDYIVNGDITLNLGDKGIWLDWHSYENGRDNGTKGFMMYNLGFKYQTINSQNIKVIVNGQQLTFDQNPVMVNDRVLVPIRTISESMGAEVSWDDVRKIGRVVGITKGSRYISFCVDDTEYNSNYSPSSMMIRDGNSDGRFVHLDAPVTIYNDRTLVPVRAVSEAFDAKVTWDGNTQTVNISTK